MASIIWSNVTNFASELSTVAADAQTDILAHVNVTLKVSTFGGEAAPKLKLARIYLAAHMGTVSLTGASASGPVISEKAGELSRQYANPTGATSDELLDSTPYGKLYRLLVRQSPRGPIVL